MKKGADFSECGLYRYSLWRIWDEIKPLVMFIGLNPSTANADTDDATIKRVVKISQNLGYGGVYMCNCFSYISTNPAFLQREDLPAMMRNAEIIKRVAQSCKDVVFAWGNFSIVRETGIDRKLSESFPNAKALHINKNGSPKHPLYCKSDIEPVLYITQTSVQRCRICGCSDFDACTHPEHGNCWWIEDNLCSHCMYWPGESKRLIQL